MNLRGILLPFTTPFKQNEDLDLESLRANIQRWNQTGISGYVALGSTGERVNLDEREYLEVIETARSEVPANLTFIVGAGQQSTRQTVCEVKRAAAAGADAVLVITPGFYRAAITPDALVQHYTTVAEASPVPVILYSMPDLTGVAIEPETVAQLSEHPNIVGIKDSSANMLHFKETMRLVDAEFAVLTGNGTVLYAALSAGARGAVLAVGCAAAEYCLEIHSQVVSGDNETAAALQDKLTPLALAVTKRYGIGGLKAALDLTGLKGGAVRAPLKSPGPDARQEIAQLLEAVINDTASRNKSGDTSRTDLGGFAGALRT
ncbi:MAG: dihydrodipicolinate synthase family protein [Pyrinomonadaceae bacterium]